MTIQTFWQPGPRPPYHPPVPRPKPQYASPQRDAVVRMVAEGVVYSTNMCALMGLRLQSVNKMLRRLENDGLLTHEMRLVNRKWCKKWRLV